MNDELQVYHHEKLGDLRALLENGVPMFLAVDAAKALKYSNPQKAIRDHVDEEDKLTEQFVLSGQRRDVIMINESGLYSLILSSKLPAAKAFKRWVTSEVLPSIRKTGGYIATKQDDSPEAIMARAVLVAQDTLKRHKEQIEKLQADNASKDKQIIALTPDAEYTRKVLTADGTHLTNVIAKEMGMSAVTLNKKLQGLGVQYKERGIWVLTAKYQDKGYTKTTTHDFLKSDGSIGTRIQTEWTEAGRKWLHQLRDENRI